MRKKPNLGLTLIGIGIISGLLSYLSPGDLKQVFYFMEHLTYVGVFYVIYSPFKQKKLVVTGVIVLMIGQSLAAGMFGELIYLTACSFCLIILGKNIQFRTKLGAALLGIFMITLLQSVKVDYRARSWTQAQGADPIYFGELIVKRITDLNSYSMQIICS